MEKVILTTFTDPMMGLSYESELIMNHLKKEYGEFIELGNKLFTACIVCHVLYAKNGVNLKNISLLLNHLM